MDTTRTSLLARIKDPADTRAWADFDAVYRPMVFRYARQLGLKPVEAEEVAQLVMVRVARRIGNFQYDPQKGRFRGWLFTLVQHQIHDLRARNTTPVAESDVFHRLAEEETPETIFERIWQEEHLRHCLALIRAEVEHSTYQAFHMHVIEQMSVDDVCQELGMTPNQVYKIKWRITRKLIERFKDYPDMA